MSLSRYGLTALGVEDEAFNAAFTDRFLHSRLGKKRVLHNIALMQEAMEKVYRAISTGRGVRVSVRSTTQSIDGEHVDRAPLEDMIVFIAEVSKYSFSLCELPGGEKSLHFDSDAVSPAGRPKKGSAEARDWSQVDWSRSNAEISRGLGVKPQTVAAQRKRYAN